MNRLKELRLRAGYTQEMLGNFLGVQKAAICKYETGRASLPQDMLLRLANLFSVSTDYILKRNPLSDFTGSTQEIIKIPIVGRVHAGLPILAEENISDYISVPQSDLKNGEYFFMEVEGDCMEDAHIVEGALVLVRLQPHIENSQVAVVRINDEVVLRRAKWEQNQLILYPANQNYAPMIVSGGDVQIIGRVLEVRIQGL